jgi:hypothetical protein
MKIGTLVIGGLAGAAVVLMMQRNQTMSAVAAGVGQNLKQRMSSMKDDAIEKASNMKFASSFSRSTDNGRNASKSFSSDEGGLDKVKQMIAQDKEVSHEVNSILESSGQHRI